MSWQQHAACAGKDPELWYASAPKAGALTPAQREAKRLALDTCAACPVRAECADAGRDEDYGIWGGLTPADRAREAGTLPPLRRRGPAPGPARQRRAPSPRGVRVHGLRGTYTHGCRCEACCEAEREYKRQYRAARRAYQHQDEGTAA